MLCHHPLFLYSVHPTDITPGLKIKMHSFYHQSLDANSENCVKHCGIELPSIHEVTLCHGNPVKFVNGCLSGRLKTPTKKFFNVG